MEYINEIVNLLEKNKLFNKEDIENILNIIIKEENIEDYVKFIDFDMTNNSCACYVRKTKLLNINYNKIIKDLENNKYGNSILSKNIIILSVIFHEIEHIKQYKFIENSDEKSMEKDRLTIELIKGIDEMLDKYEVITSQIGFISIYKYFKNFHKFNKLKSFYRSNMGYYSKLSEKSAYFTAFEKCQQILNKINNIENIKLYEELEKEKYKYLLYGYRDLLIMIKEPYLYFKKNQKYYDPNYNYDLSIREDVENLSLEERMVNGYPITKNEYKYLKIRYKNKNRD